MEPTLKPEARRLQRAIAFAVEAHTGQHSFSGRPYILHPLRVMHQMDTIDEMIVAVLHDVLEDTNTKVHDVEKFGAEVVAPLLLLTKREGQDYEQYINAVASDPIARKVKLADLQDNMRVERLLKFTDGSAQRLCKYHKAYMQLCVAEEVGASRLCCKAE